jgi:hypothetical protein
MEGVNSDERIHSLHVIRSLFLNHLAFYPVLWALFLLSGEVAGLSLIVSQMLAVAVAAVFTVAYFYRHRSSRRGLAAIIQAGFIVGTLVGLFVSRERPLQMLCYSTWLAGMAFFSPPGDERRSITLRVARGGLFVMILCALLEIAPTLRLFLDAFSAWLTAHTNELFGGASLGASASGLVVFLMVLGVVIVNGVLRNERRTLMGWIVSLEVLLLVHHGFLQGFVTSQLARAAIKASFIGVATFLLLGYLATRSRSEEEPAAPGWPARRFAPIGLGVSVVLASFLVSGLPSFFLSRFSVREILFLDHRMQGTWEIPAEMSPGLAFRGATFGLLPQYLEAHGYRTETSTVITEAALFDKDLDLVIVINPGQPFSVAERALLSDFIRQGGGLLALGDHTDVGGIMRALNSLLAPFGIGLRFDSAVPLGGPWEGRLAIEYPFGERYTVREVPISIGASVWIEPSFLSYPLLTGREAFSDPGNRENVQEALLGNRSYDRGERYGGILVAGERYWGKGKIVLFGDTQAYQNSSMASSYKQLLALVSWMCHGPPASVLVLSSVLGLAMLGGLIVLLPSRYGHTETLIVVSVAATVGFFAGTALMGEAISATPLSGNRIAYIDLGYGNAVNYRGLDDKGLSGLIVNLSRNGYLPVWETEPLAPRIEDGVGLVVSVAPTRPFSESDVSALIRFVEGGGTVIFSTSWPYAKAVAPVLEPLGLELLNVPLGQIQSEPSGAIPALQFIHAWPLAGTAEWASLASVELGGETFTVIAQRPLGKGRVVVIGDDKFLLAGHLEGDQFYNEETIEFLNGLLSGAF